MGIALCFLLLLIVLILCVLRHKHRLRSLKTESEESGRQSVSGKEIDIPDINAEPPIYLYMFEKKNFSKNYTAFFKNGILYDISPRNYDVSLYEDIQIAHDARYIVSDSVKYDLCSAEDIRSLKIPQYDKLHRIPSHTGDLAYILKMRVPSVHHPELAVPLAYKVVNLMTASSLGWGKKDYFRIVAHLWEIGATEYGDDLYNKIKELFPIMFSADSMRLEDKETFKRELAYAKQLKTNYLEILHSGYICGNCAPFHNRVYCIRGKDKRFPKLPDFIMNDCGLHCNPSYSAYNYYKGCTISKYTIHMDGKTTSIEVDAIQHSNRPFVDDRTEIEKQKYIDWGEEQQRRELSDEEYFSKETWTSKYKDRLEYQKIKELVGDGSPKSYNGWRRMKAGNSPNYQKIVQLALEHGIHIR